MNNKIVTILVLFLNLLATGIANPDSDTPDKNEILKFHAIYSEEIRVIMNELNESIYEAETSKTEKELHEQSLEHLIETANDLIFATLNLKQALPGFNLTNEEKDIFQAMAMQLQLEASNIRTQAETDNYLAIENSYQRLNDTCAACHELFRF